MTRDEMIAELSKVLNICQSGEIDAPSLRAAVCVRVGPVLAALSTPAPVAAPPADLVAKVAEWQKAEQKAVYYAAVGDDALSNVWRQTAREKRLALLAFPLPEVPK